jgi:hypothetical protein
VNETAFLLGVSLAALMGVWVAADARGRGLSLPASVAWGMGVFMALIVFLPLYLLLRARPRAAPRASPPIPETPSARVCGACGALYLPPARFCPWCGAPLAPSP